MATVAAVAMAVVGTSPGIGSASSAAAQLAGPAPSCQAGVCTITYDSPGTGQAFTVPPGVTQLDVTLYGGDGGSASYSGFDYPQVTNGGGDGAKITTALAVSPGEVLGVDVGGAGTPGSATGAAAGRTAAARRPRLRSPRSPTSPAAAGAGRPTRPPLRPAGP